jgi:N-acylneuraminate cytidylyltransferase
MKESLRILGVVAARGGSKGLPRKNLLDVAGRPMIAWSIAAAAGSRRLTRTIVSTDDEEIATTARAWGGDVPFLRPAELATDTSSIIDALMHAADMLADDFSHIVLLQASSPLRMSDDIDGAISLCVESGAPACVSVCQVSKGPEWMFEVDALGRLRPLLGGDRPARRQDITRTAVLPNGAVYVAELEWLREHMDFYSPDTVAYLMPQSRSADVDVALDLVLARAILQGVA